MIEKQKTILPIIISSLFSIIIGLPQMFPIETEAFFDSKADETEFIRLDYQLNTESKFAKEIISEVIPIYFETVYEADAEIERGQEKIVQVGENGEIIRNYELEFYKEVEVNRILLLEERKEAQNEIIKYGTKIVVRDLETEFGNLNYSQKMNVYAVAYTSESAGGTGYTATGTKAHFGTVAVDPNVIPLGTRMYIPGYGIGIAEDTGGAIKGEMVDLFYEGSHGWWEAKRVDIYILTD